MTAAAPGWVERARRRVARPETYLRLLALAVVVAVVTLAVLLRDSLPGPRKAGYVGIFVLSLTGSATIVLPVPGIAGVYVGGAILNPLLVALTAGVAEAIGEITGYLVGFGGRGVIERHRFYRRVCTWMERRGMVVLFIMSVIPNPAFDIIGVAAGSLRFPLWRFLLSVGLGKVAKNAAIAYAGAFSMPWIQRVYQGIVT